MLRMLPVQEEECYYFFDEKLGAPTVTEAPDFVVPGYMVVTPLGTQL